MVGVVLEKKTEMLKEELVLKTRTLVVVKECRILDKLEGEADRRKHQGYRRTGICW